MATPVLANDAPRTQFDRDERNLRRITSRLGSPAKLSTLLAALADDLDANADSGGETIARFLQPGDSRPAKIRLSKDRTL